MEKIRLFKRKCLRACINMYKTPESNFTKTISNHRLYKEARITRIDLFIQKIIRKHWANISNIHSNSLILHSIYPNPQYYERIKETGYTPPKSFIHLDSTSHIQNSEKYPIIYHYNRKTYNKTIPYNSNLSSNDPKIRLYKLLCTN
ncbi:hypothetical protein WN51_08685 [Melipona quadrifasciata]|uniref:Uncharacterized protein n=1 Tax=Melipona quadrifasciata TaxID=166423 RepID=A0A0M9A903_9HYME|nr:hypothetical protein WN51_08685 [Melipona quadrifasciata]